MNDIDYIKFYDDEMLNLIQNEIVPYLYQWDLLSDSEFYSAMVLRLYDLNYNFEEIYYGIAIYLFLGQNLIDNSNQLMNIVKKSIIRMYIRIENTRNLPNNLVNHLANHLANHLPNHLANHLPNLNGLLNINNINSTSGIIDFIQQSFSEIIQNRLVNLSALEPVKLTVAQEELDKIPIVEFKSLKKDIIDKNSSCTICLDDFEPDNKVRIVKCEHVFHRECIDKWLLENNFTCPTCREEVADHIANITNENEHDRENHNDHYDDEYQNLQNEHNDNYDYDEDNDENIQDNIKAINEDDDDEDYQDEDDDDEDYQDKDDNNDTGDDEDDEDYQDDDKDDSDLKSNN